MGVKNQQYRNQSTLHEWLSKSSSNFLRNMATQKGLVWRQEHTMHNGMRPDAIGICSLQYRFEKELRKYKDNPQGYFNDAREGYISGDYLFIFESKVTYADFKNTFNGDGEYKESPYANFHYLIIPNGFNDAYDLSNLPDYWGILHPDPRALKVIRNPTYVDIDRMFFLEAAYTMLSKWNPDKFNHSENINPSDMY